MTSVKDACPHCRNWDDRCTCPSLLDVAKDAKDIIQHLYDIGLYRCDVSRLFLTKVDQAIAKGV